MITMMMVMMMIMIMMAMKIVMMWKALGEKPSNYGYPRLHGRYPQ